MHTDKTTEFGAFLRRRAGFGSFGFSANECVTAAGILRRFFEDFSVFRLFRDQRSARR
jgi:hypothetical protein